MRQSIVGMFKRAAWVQCRRVVAERQLSLVIRSH